jgi:pectinesterase
MRVASLVFVVCLFPFGLGACGRAKTSAATVAVGDPDAGPFAGGDAAGVSTDGPTDPTYGEGCPVPPAVRPTGTPTWTTVSGLKEAQTWYASAPATYVAENILFYQNSNGGWPKNIDMTYRFGVDLTGAAKDSKSMIDNGATTTQIRYLAYMLGSWPTCQRLADSFNAGLKYLFDAQYPSNGGWPQVWPIEPADYSRRITYNDNAMVHVLQIMRDIVYRNPLFSFVSTEISAKATAALNKGVDCVLRTQIVANGEKTGWCAQHDEVTLLPAAARAYELASQSGKEGAQVLAFLMTLDLSRTDVPRQDVIDAVEAAVRFYDSVTIVGYRYVQGASDAGASDSWIEADSSAGPLWARFYNVEAPFTPFFCDRNGIKVFSLAEVGVERRGGYTWYVTDPITILGTNYPAWIAKWTIGRDVRQPPHPG